VDPDRDIAGLACASGDGDGDEFAGLSAAELRVRLGDTQARHRCRVEELEQELAEARECADEQALRIRDFEEKRAAAEALARRARTRSR
jgi:hypothetical protein